MQDALLMHRLQFAFTVTYHYLFPQLTMGLALLLVIMKTIALRTGDDHWNRSARFWAKIFGINFAMGVVTGIPMEFQFGTNWAAFSQYAGGVIGQTLAMEGVFAFFLESTFLGLFLFGEQKLGPKLHWLTAVGVLVGSWVSGYFIIATDAFMQHPVGYRLLHGEAALQSFWSLLLNPWALWQYAHNMTASVVTGSFAVAGIGAWYLLSGTHSEYAKRFVRLGVVVGVVASVVQLFPTGDAQGRMVADHQPVTLAAMEGLFTSQRGAPLVLVGQPNMREKRLDNPVHLPKALSFLTYRQWNSRVRGLDAFPKNKWPTNIPLVYYSYHVMVGLGTAFILVLAIAAFKLWRGTLYASRSALWVLLLSTPFPYVATTAGWITAEVGRQPWVIYGLMRTSAGASQMVSAGNALFTLLGFMGVYAVLSVLFLFLVGKEIAQGPEAAVPTAAESPGTSSSSVN